MSVSASKPSPPRTSTVVCIGAGISAIALGARLKISYGFDDVVFYEQDDQLGGTWHANSYPGAACDVPTALYSFSFAQNAEWTEVYPPSGEIKTYLLKVAADYDIPSKTTFRTQVYAARWDDARDRWDVYLRNLVTGEEYVHECKILISAIGLLANPNVPDIKGRETFAGKQMHTARWDHGVQLEGKRVALIGNGCTAAQITPRIAPQVGHLTQFIRSKHWIQPSTHFEYTPVIRWALKWLPLAQRLHRFLIFLGAEWGYRLQGSSAWSAEQRKKDMARVSSYMRREAPEKYHSLLIPDFQISCKRRIHDPSPGYLASLNRPNVTLTDSSIVEITRDGVRTSAGTLHPADVIIYATGFATSNYLANIDIRGRGGESIQAHWDKLGGVGAYNCTAVSNFPNFFMLLGPNTGTGHTSCIMACENTANYALKVSAAILSGAASRVEPKASAERSYVQRLQAALSTSVFNTGGCSAWYRDKASGWNAMMYPWSQSHFLYACHFVRWKDWDVTYTGGSGAGTGAAATLVLVAVAMLALAYFNLAGGVGVDPARLVAWGGKRVGWGGKSVW